MNIEDVKQVAVVGAGNMGSGIAILLSRVGGYNVIMSDTSKEIVDSGLNKQVESLKKHFVDKGKMTTDEMKTVVNRIKTTADISEAAGNADFVIEAVFENMNLKKSIFEELDKSAPAHSILASNTSYLSITEIASSTKRAELVAGMHFFNPPAIMKLAEVVRAALTSEDTASTVYKLAVKLGKDPVYCRDTYGFLANRAVISRNDAVELLWSHVATPEDIDKAVRLGYNRPVGPLELGDMAGSWSLDVHLEDERIRELGWEKGRVHPMIKMMVRAGYVGGLGNKGVYNFWNDVISKW